MVRGDLTDTYTVYSASAIAGLSFVRALGSGFMLLIGYVIFDGEQSVVPGFVIAGIATVFCVVSCLLFRYGKRLREKSKSAKYSLQVHMRTQLGDA